MLVGFFSLLTRLAFIIRDERGPADGALHCASGDMCALMMLSRSLNLPGPGFPYICNMGVTILTCHYKVL